MSKEDVLTVLRGASVDIDFYGQLIDDYAMALKDYDLTSAETTAIGTGDVRWIESHIGTKIDESLMEKVFMPLISQEQW